MEDKKRCGWCEINEPMVKYHDEEWGVPVHEDRKHFEFLLLEVMQCGLNWNMMIQKRSIFRECFAQFDFEKTAVFGEEDIERILNVPGMIRSRRKIEAVINNAKQFLKVIEEWGSFDNYLWSFTDNMTYVYLSHRQSGPVAKNELSDRGSADLKKRGFKYTGSVTIYSHLQACGIINDHEPDCWLYEELMKNSNVKIFE